MYLFSLGLSTVLDKHRAKTLENGELKLQLLIFIACHSISHGPDSTQDISLSLGENKQ